MLKRLSRNHLGKDDDPCAAPSSKATCQTMGSAGSKVQDKEKNSLQIQKPAAAKE